MADEAEASGKGTAPSRRRRIGGTKVPWLVMIGVAVLVAVIAILATQKPEGKGENKGARAVLVSTNDRPRTVLVPPCATGAPLASEPPAQIKETPGAISVLLPRGGGIRTVIVPECTAARGQNAMGAANLPSAAFVMPQGTQLPQIHPGSSSGGSTSGGEALKLETFTRGIQAQLVIPDGSTADSVVVDRCQKVTKNAGAHFGNGPTIVLNPKQGDPKTALAPPC